MTYSRGIVKSIKVEIEYPNGFKKETTLVPKQEFRALIFSDSLMDADMKKAFNVSKTDWKLNPTMVIVDGDTMGTTCEFPQCQIA